MIPTEIKNRLIESATVLKSLPGPKFPSGLPQDSVSRIQRTSPAVFQATFGDRWEVIDVDEKGHREMALKSTEEQKYIPTALEIDRAWQAFSWLEFLYDEEQRFLWDWANQMPLWQIAQKYKKKSEGSVRYKRDELVKKIAQELR